MARVEDQDHLVLAGEFPPATREQWLALVEGALKGRPFDSALIAKTYDGLRIDPLAPRALNAAAIHGRALGERWQIVQRADHPDAGAANREALHDLEQGATALKLVFAGAAGAYGFGLDPKAGTLARVLEGVYLDAGVAVEIEAGWHAAEAPRELAGLVQSRGHAPAAVQVRLGIDPIGAAAAAGGSPAAWSGLAPAFGRQVHAFADQGFDRRLAAADGRIIHNAGGSEVQELAFALACALAYVRALASAEIGLDAARRMIFFRLAADADQFLTLAKFRALRLLWARIEEACGLVPEPAFIAADTAWRMMTKRDPHVNMLRTTVAALAAALGGGDAIAVLPFTAALGLPERLARRMARNTQLILIEEAHLARVSDPGAGAGGVENLTDQMCAAAWARFQQIEHRGGIWPCLEQGTIQREVEETRSARAAAVARRKDALTGTSEFATLAEVAADVSLAVATTLPALSAGATVAPMRPWRLAEPFEALRDASDRALAQSGTRPAVFLATLGPLASFGPRATFARNFLAAGGIEARGGDADATLDGMVEAFRASGARLACLCATDEAYGRDAVAAARALTKAGAVAVMLAGRPGDLADALKSAGVTQFIYAGCDAVATLARVHDILGVA